jgi:hypothetical protein
MWALHSAKPAVALGVNPERDQHRWGGGSTGEPQTTGKGASSSVRDEILTTEEVCTLLKMKEATLYRHAS